MAIKVNKLQLAITSFKYIVTLKKQIAKDGYTMILFYIKLKNNGGKYMKYSKSIIAIKSPSHLQEGRKPLWSVRDAQWFQMGVCCTSHTLSLIWMAGTRCVLHSNLPNYICLFNSVINMATPARGSVFAYFYLFHSLLSTVLNAPMCYSSV